MAAKTDIARRVWNHTWKLDPIVRSLLDTDFYKLLMLQMIWKLHHDVDATFSVINRTKSVRLADDIDEQELQRGGVSYTINTLRDYHQRFPEAKIFYLIGGDHVQKLPAWRDAEELARLADFVVVPRPGQVDIPFPKPFHGQALKGFPLGVSSSQIRARVKAGEPIDHLVPATVAEAIRGAGLYTNAK